MRREFAALESAMQAFIEQPDYPTMIVNGTDGDIVFPVRILQNWDRQWDSPLFLIFPFECDDVDEYLQACIDLLAIQIDAVNDELTDEGETPWPPLPLICLDPRQASFHRLRAAIDYVGNRVTDDIDIVWGLLPATLDDSLGYKNLILPLLALTGFEDWMEGHRFLVRDDRRQPFLTTLSWQEHAERPLTLNIDFSPEKMADRMVRIVNDPNTPIPDRMQALMQLAAVDVTHRRYGQALEKYDLLHAYHAEKKDSLGQAMALGGAGDVAMRLGNLELAKTRYQQALAVAVKDGNLQILLNLLQSAGECCLNLGLHDEAEGYLSLANRAAGKLVSPYAKIQIMEKLGVAQLGSRKTNEAAQTWLSAKEMCHEFDCPGQANSILDHLIGLYSAVGMKEQAGIFAREKVDLADESGA